MEVGQAWVTLVPSAKGFGKNTEKALGGDLERAGKSGGGKFSAAFGKVAKVGAVGAAAVIGTALAKGFSRLKGIDEARAKLTGLGHSAATVEKVMENALASVRGTAFGLDSAATSAAGAIAAGIKPGKDLERNLKLVADAATIAGVDMSTMGAIFNKVSASNKVQMDVINQLHDAGVPALQMIAKEMGVTAEEASAMASKGKVDFATFQNAMEKGLGGAALASGNTFSGALANVGAALGRLGANVLGGAFAKMPGIFGNITASLDGLGPRATQVGEAIGNFITQMEAGEGAGGRFADILRTAASIIGNVAGFLRDHNRLVLAAIVAYAGFKVIVATMRTYRAIVFAVASAKQAYAMATYGMAAADTTAAVRAGALSGTIVTKTAAIWASTAATAKNLAVNIQWQLLLLRQTATTIAAGVAHRAVAIATGVWTAAQWLLNAALTANPIGLVVAGIALLVGGLVLAYKNSETFRNIVNAAFTLVKTVVGDVVGWLGTWVPGVFNKVKTVASVVFSAIAWYVTTYIGVVRKVLGTIAGGIAPAIRAFTNFYSNVKATISKVIAVVRSIKSAITGVFRGAGSWLSGIGKNIVQGLISGIRSMGGAIGDALVALLPGPLKKFASKLGIKSPSTVFAGFGKNIGEGLVIGIDRTQSQVMRASSQLADAVSISARAQMSPQRLSLPPSPATSTSQPVTVEDLAAALSGLGINVTVGADKRTKAQWFIQGKEAAGALA